MVDIVPAEDIERIVGAERHTHHHQARAVSAEQTVYVLHSERCLVTTPDLRDCRFSRALARGIDLGRWDEDVAVFVAIEGGRLVPIEVPTDSARPGAES